MAVRSHMLDCLAARNKLLGHVPGILDREDIVSKLFFGDITDSPEASQLLQTMRC